MVEGKVMNGDHLLMQNNIINTKSAGCSGGGGGSNL